MLCYRQQDYPQYKSWSALKKLLDSFLCPSLAGKISYFYTTYHKNRNTNLYGRAAIRYEKTELVSFSWDVDYDKQFPDWSAAADRLTDEDIQAAGSPQNAADQVYGDLMKSKWLPEATLCNHDFFYAAAVYVNMEIAAALASDNFLFRVFAFMDRRVGKRTLLKIKEDTLSLPDWVKQFYLLRCNAEGISL